MLKYVKKVLNSKLTVERYAERTLKQKLFVERSKGTGTALLVLKGSMSKKITVLPT